MTGVGGRPEVIIEGSNNIDGPWRVSIRWNLPSAFKVAEHSFAGGQRQLA